LTYPLHLCTATALPWENKFVAFGLARRARQTIELLERETPKFIPPDLWAPNSPDLNSVDYRIRGLMQDHVYQTPVRDTAYLRQCLIDTWNDLSQNVVDDAVDEWRKRLQACVNEKGGHFEQLNKNITIFWVKCRLVVWINWMFY